MLCISIVPRSVGVLQLLCVCYPPHCAFQRVFVLAVEILDDHHYPSKYLPQTTPSIYAYPPRRLRSRHHYMACVSSTPSPRRGGSLDLQAGTFHTSSMRPTSGSLYKCFCLTSHGLFFTFLKLIIVLFSCNLIKDGYQQHYQTVPQSQNTYFVIHTWTDYISAME